MHRPTPTSQWAGKYPESDVQGQNFPASIGGDSHTNYVYHKARVTVNGTVFEFPLFHIQHLGIR